MGALGSHWQDSAYMEPNANGSWQPLLWTIALHHWEAPRTRGQSPLLLPTKGQQWPMANDLLTWGSLGKQEPSVLWFISQSLSLAPIGQKMNPVCKPSLALSLYPFWPASFIPSHIYFLENHLHPSLCQALLPGNLTEDMYVDEKGSSGQNVWENTACC